jgi:hypothetical protein
MNDEWLERYSRQILLPEVDFSGQEALAASSVAIIGCGGLGSLIGLYLAGAGVGGITLIDDDVVEISNLHRQLAFRESDLGESKSLALCHQLQRLNSDIAISAHNYRLGEDNALDETYLTGGRFGARCNRQPRRKTHIRIGHSTIELALDYGCSHTVSRSGCRPLVAHERRGAISVLHRLKTLSGAQIVVMKAY